MRLHHIAFRTDDLPRLERFYVDVLGMSIRRRAEGSVWLGAGETILMLERRTDEEPTISPSTRELVAFAIAPAEHAVYTDRLDGAGVAIEAHTPYTIYFRDPDGRRIALSAYPELLG